MQHAPVSAHMHEMLCRQRVCVIHAISLVQSQFWFGAELIGLIKCHFELIDREWLFKPICFYRWFCLLSAASDGGSRQLRQTS